MRIILEIPDTVPPDEVDRILWPAYCLIADRVEVGASRHACRRLFNSEGDVIGYAHPRLGVNVAVDEYGATDRVSIW